MRTIYDRARSEAPLLGDLLPAFRRMPADLGPLETARKRLEQFGYPPARTAG